MCVRAFLEGLPLQLPFFAATVNMLFTLDTCGDRWHIFWYNSEHWACVTHGRFHLAEWVGWSGGQPSGALDSQSVKRKADCIPCFTMGMPLYDWNVAHVRGVKCMESPRTILIIDDDIAMQTVLEIALREAGSGPVVPFALARAMGD